MGKEREKKIVAFFKCWKGGGSTVSLLTALLNKFAFCPCLLSIYVKLPNIKLCQRKGKYDKECVATHFLKTRAQICWRQIEGTAVRMLADTGNLFRVRAPTIVTTRGASPALAAMGIFLEDKSLGVQSSSCIQTQIFSKAFFIT